MFLAFYQHRKLKNIQLWVKHSAHHCHLVSCPISIYSILYILWREEQTTDTVGVWRQASERFLFNRNNKNKVSKGENSVQNKQCIWCPRRVVGFVKEGQCSRRTGPGKGRILAAVCATPRVRGVMGNRFVLLIKRPGILAQQPSHRCGTCPDHGSDSPCLRWRSIPQRSLPGPTRTPACMHGKETGLSRRGALCI